MSLSSNIWLGYSEAQEWPSGLAGRDPLRLAHVSDALADALVPGMTNQTQRSAYFKIIALAYDPEITDGLQEYSLDKVEQILLLERAWTIGLFLTGQLKDATSAGEPEEGAAGRKSYEHIYGVRRASRHAAEVEEWRFNRLLEPDCILINQRGTGGYGYYHVTMETLGLQGDDFSSAVVFNKKNRFEVARALCRKWRGIRGTGKTRWAMERLAWWVPLGIPDRADKIIKNRVLQNDLRNNLYRSVRKLVRCRWDEKMALLELRKHPLMGKMAKVILVWERFARKALSIFSDVCGWAERGETRGRGLDCRDEARGAFEALSSCSDVLLAEDPLYDFLKKAQFCRGKELLTELVNYHVEAQKLKNRMPWVYMTRGGPRLCLSQPGISVPPRGGLVHGYRIYSLCRLLRDTRAGGFR
ncbi:MAG: hypothetical protein QXH42_06215 [Thermoplasmata archaeon]